MLKYFTLTLFVSLITAFLLLLFSLFFFTTVISNRYNESIETISDNYEQIGSEVENRLNQLRQSLHSEDAKSDELVLQASEAIKQAINTNSNEAISRLESISVSLSSTLRIRQFLSLVFIFTILSFTLLLITRKIRTTLGTNAISANELARTIAQGDLTVTPSSQPLSGTLQESLYSIAEQLRTFVTHAIQDGKVQQMTAAELALASTDMLNGAEQAGAKAQTVAAATEEMSTNMATMADASTHTSDKVTMVADDIEAMSHAIEEISQNATEATSKTKEAVSVSDHASQQVNELGDAVLEIGKFTEVITEISEQTNLLALNATIEAARAGDAGKGFAVVANEIKDLAKQTAESTREIKVKIETIQSSTSNTVTEISQITRVINGIDNIVSSISTAISEQTATANNIAENIGEAANGIQEINKNIEQASLVSGEIARDIVDVSKVAAEVKEGGTVLISSSNSLKNMSDNIAEQTKVFNVGKIAPIQTSSEVRQDRDLLRWSDSLSVGITSLDLQHKKLVDLANRLYRCLHDSSRNGELGSLLDELVQYTQYHFQSEEKLFDKYNYDKRDEHIKIHQELIAKVSEFYALYKKGEADISSELLEFIKDWLMHHILEVDMQYSKPLQKAGVH